MVAPAEPCSDADCHVSDNFDPENLIGYMATMEKPGGWLTGSGGVCHRQSWALAVC